MSNSVKPTGEAVQGHPIGRSPNSTRVHLWLVLAERGTCWKPSQDPASRALTLSGPRSTSVISHFVITNPNAVAYNVTFKSPEFIISYNSEGWQSE